MSNGDDDRAESETGLDVLLDGVEVLRVGWRAEESSPVITVGL